MHTNTRTHTHMRVAAYTDTHTDIDTQTHGIRYNLVTMNQHLLGYLVSLIM